jgi:hypothetical protein
MSGPSAAMANPEGRASARDRKKTPAPAPKGASGEAREVPEKLRRLASRWQGRIVMANRDYEQWEKRFQCQRIARYWEGKQWGVLQNQQNLSTEQQRERYTINLFFAAVEELIPTLLLDRPTVKTEAKPGADGLTVDAAAKSTLIERTVQTFIDEPETNFAALTELSIRDAMARFGMVEVGYSADWVENPNADQPMTNAKDDQPLATDDGGTIKQPSRLPTPGSECCYIKQIAAEDFRAWPGHPILEYNRWVAYREWHPLAAVKANKEYEYTENLKETGKAPDPTTDLTDDRVVTAEHEEDPAKHQGMVCLWRIFDLDNDLEHVLAEGHPAPLMHDKPLPFLRLAGLIFYPRKKSFYPLPPGYNWLHPQDEINESREMQKMHRRRLGVRRYMRESRVEQDEWDKLETGEDGVCITVDKVDPSPIMPIPDAESPNSNWQQLAATERDFSMVSGVGGDARGVPESQTATQANIINQRSMIRESVLRLKVAAWLSKIARLMFLTAREHMVLPINVNVKGLQDVRKIPGVIKQIDTWAQIRGSDFKDLDVDVKVDVTSMSPVAEDQERLKFTAVLQAMANQNMLIVLMEPNPTTPEDPSPLLRKFLTLYGIKSDGEVREIFRIGQILVNRMTMMAAAAVAGQMQGGGAGAAKMPPMVGAPAARPPIGTGGPAGGQPGGLAQPQPAAGMPTRGPM